MLTLVEASKLAQTPLQQGIIEIFPRTSPVLERLPFLPVAGNAYSYNREETLPGVSFRGINEPYTESTGIVNPLTETLKVFGGTSKVDRALVKSQGNLNDLRAIQDSMQAKATALLFTKCFFRGDSVADPREFDGLQKRIVGTQLVPAGATAGGDPLTLAMLDELIDAVQGGPDVLFMNKAMRRKVNSLMRQANQATEIVSDAFGRQIPSYAGIPVAVIENDNLDQPILDFTEAAPGGGAPQCTSIYACKFGVKEYISGLQCGELEVIDQGLVDIWHSTLIEWIASIAIFHPRSAARLWGVSAA